MLASQSSHCAEGKKELCCHQSGGKEPRRRCAAVQHRCSRPCWFVLLCCCWLCSFTSRRLRHVWVRRSDRCRGENHQQQTQDQWQRGKSFVSLYLFCLCLKAFLTRSEHELRAALLKSKVKLCKDTKLYSGWNILQLTSVWTAHEFKSAHSAFTKLSEVQLFNEFNFSSNYVVIVTAVLLRAICVSLASAKPTLFHIISALCSAVIACYLSLSGSPALMDFSNDAWLLNVCPVSHANLKSTDKKNKNCACVGVCVDMSHATVWMHGSFFSDGAIRVSKQQMVATPKTSLMITLLWETGSGLLCLCKQQILFLPPEHNHLHSQRFYLRLELWVMSLSRKTC